MSALSAAEFARKYPEAFAALPEAYQNDSCLEFLDGPEYDYLTAFPRKDQRSILGDWESAYINGEWLTEPVL